LNYRSVNADGSVHFCNVTVTQMQGFLYKRGRGILPRYGKRLFCVSGTDLRYKLEVSDELWATTVSLSGAIITRGAAGRGRFHFELATTVRLFTLYATTSEERQAWIKALRLAGCGEGPPLTRDEERESSARAPPSPANPPILIQAIDRYQRRRTLVATHSSSGSSLHSSAHPNSRRSSATQECRRGGHWG
jgi:hypothetical protein